MGGMQWYDDPSNLGQLSVRLRIGVVKALLWYAVRCVMVNGEQIAPAC